MKRIWVGMLLLALLPGCGKRALLPYAREMDDTVLLRVVGIDAWGDGVSLAAAAGSRASEDAVPVLSACGSSVPAAAQAVRQSGECGVSFGHVDQLLVGEEQAIRGLAEWMDYLAREPELGPGAQLWMVWGEASRAVETVGVAERLAQLSTDGEPGAVRLGCTAARLMSVMARDGSTYLPALTVTDGETLAADGYALLRRGKLVGRMDEEAAVGLELMEEEGAGRVVELSLEDGTTAALVLKRVRTNVRPVFLDRTLAGVDVTCDLEARVVQVGRQLNEDELMRLCQRLERMQGERILRALEFGQHWDADFLDLKRRVQMACPGKREEIERQWRQMFRALDFRVEVRGEVEYSGSEAR